MSTRHRDPRERAAEVPPPTPGESAPDDGAAERARRLLDLGDDLIRRALSGDSQRFLAQNRQQGGE